jgi:hypothetical protein
MPKKYARPLPIMVASLASLTLADFAFRSASPDTLPRLLVDTDFTQGSLDRRWQRFGNGEPSFVGLQAPNRRDFPQALVRTLALGGHPWSGIAWSGEDIAIDKQADVVVLKFSAFADVASPRRVYYGVEVAMLEARPEFAGPPDYGHDLSFEAEQVFSTKLGPDQVQLFANVENQATATPGTRQAHSPTPFNQSALLDRTYQNLVIWRNQPGRGTTNIEQWGEFARADYTVASELNSRANPTSPLALFNRIQIALFRAPVQPGDQLRSGISAKTAQIGLTHVQVGITRRSDFNLDYAVTLDDFFTLTQHWGEQAATLLEGDASNDGQVDEADFQILKTQFGVGQPQIVTRYRAEPDPHTILDSTLRVVVHLSTGEIEIVGLPGQRLLGYQLRSPSGGFTGLAPQRRWADGVRSHRSTELGEGGLIPVLPTGLGPVYDRLKARRDLTFRWQARLGEPLREGPVLYQE